MNPTVASEDYNPNEETSFRSMDDDKHPLIRNLMRDHGELLAKLQLAMDILLASISLIGAIKMAGLSIWEEKSVIVIHALMILIIYHHNGVYQKLRFRSMWNDLFGLLWAWIYALMIFVSYLYLDEQIDKFPRDVMILWGCGTYLIQAFIHITVRSSLQEVRLKGRNLRHALLIGHPHYAKKLMERLTENAWLGVKVVGQVSLTSKDSLYDTTGGPAHLGHVDKLNHLVKKHDIQMIYITPSLKETGLIGEVTRRVINENVEIYWAPDLSCVPLTRHQAMNLEGQPVLCLSSSPMIGFASLIKMLFDRISALVLIILTSPILIVTAALVKFTSPGSIIFRQKRQGIDGKIFLMYKFRSMRQDECKEAFQQAVKNDPRVTSVGKFIRKYSIDELPQLFNVLNGTMSLVGPRPHPIDMNRYYKDKLDVYMIRHRIKPGITGWAQINGARGETKTLRNMEERVRHDLYYINNWSLGLDLKICIKTFFCVFHDTSAY